MFNQLNVIGYIGYADFIIKHDYGLDLKICYLANSSYFLSYIGKHGFVILLHFYSHYKLNFYNYF